MNKKKILVIDDEEILTKTFVKLLERNGYDVLIAKRGDDAIEMAEEDPAFDLMICDVRMPGIDGIQTVIRMREMFQMKNLKCPPQIFVSGYADEVAEAEARKLAPNAFFYKPFDAGALMNTVKDLLHAQQD